MLAVAAAALVAGLIAGVRDPASSEGVIESRRPAQRRSSVPDQVTAGRSRSRTTAPNCS